MRLDHWIPWVGVLLALAPTRVFAHPLVDEGIDRYHEADFQGALEALERAEASGDLSRADLADLFYARALIRFATGGRDAMATDLSLLAALEPDRPMGREVPPDVRARFAVVQASSPGPPELAVRARAVPGGLELVARLESGHADLVRSIRIRARAEGGSWTPSADASLQVPAATGTRVEYYVEGLGPGNAVVVTLGSPEAPESAIVSPPTGAPDETDGGLDVETGVWVGVGVAAAVAAVAAVVVAIVFATSGSEGTTQLGAPQYGWP